MQCNEFKVRFGVQVVLVVRRMHSHIHVLWKPWGGGFTTGVIYDVYHLCIVYRFSASGG